MMKAHGILKNRGELALPVRMPNNKVDVIRNVDQTIGQDIEPIRIVQIHFG